MFFIHVIHPPYLGESISSETSNGYVNEAEVTWQAFDEEADTQSTQSAHMDVTTDPQSQGSLLLSHNEALAGIGTDQSSPRAPKTDVDPVFIPDVNVFYDLTAIIELQQNNLR